MNSVGRPRPRRRTRTAGGGGAPPRALIAGLGLIGGSIGIALRRSGWFVAYIDPNVAEDDARRAGAADARGGDGDVTIVATPVDAALEIVRTLPSPLVTSVCSVMGPLRKAADARAMNFVAGHPLAGSAQRGLQAASGDLFRGKRWFVDRDEPTVRRMIGDCGGVMEIVDAAEHDTAIALTSHLPQILSTALAAYLGDRDVLRFAGGGLTTFLRLAESDGSVWQPIIDANRANIEPHIPALMKIVEEIVSGDAGAFARAQELFRRLQR